MSDIKRALLEARTRNPHYGRPGRASAAEDLRRYLAGEPLVRWHRWPETGWSWLCPDPFCQTWQTRYENEPACREEWTTHATDQHPDLDLDPAWPDTSGIALPKNWEGTRG